MRRIFHFAGLCLVAGAVTACSTDDEVIVTTRIPTAGVRFINAVPDTGAMDLRFVDKVESNAHWGMTFRNNPVLNPSGVNGVPASTLTQYKNAESGARQFRIFMNGSTAAIASTVVKDTTVTLVDTKNYTAILWGYANPTGPGRPASAASVPMKLFFFEEAVADPGAQVALRVINASDRAIDVRVYPKAGPVPGTATWANVLPQTVSTYVLAAPDTILYNVRAVSGTTALFDDRRALIGAIAVTGPPGPFDAVPGTTVAGSAVTLVVFAGSVAGSPGTQFATGTGSSRLMATATGYAGPRSFITDGFFIGGTVTAAGFSATNNGTSVITGRADGSTTGNQTTLSATATGYVRSAGSFVTNGFAVGDVVTATGFTNAANNGESTVTAVAALVLTVTKTGGTILEAGTTGSTTLAASPVGYSRPAGDFVADGFLIGHTITASGFATAANNGTSVITNVTPTDLTVTKTVPTVVEAAAAARTISASNSRSLAAFGSLTVTKTGGTVLDAAAASRSLTVTPAPPGPSFMWDRRPPR